MNHPRALGATLLALTLTLAACGSDGSAGGTDGPATGGTDVKVTMADNTYRPSDITLPKGEEVTFTFTNDGTVDHEALIGTEADQAEHEKDMAGDGSGAMDGHEMDGHDGAAMSGGTMSEAITVAPGESRSMTMTFDDAGTYLIGCHVPGHYEAGMKATITVE